MERNGIDPRFPAVFQPGGEDLPQGVPSVPGHESVRQPPAPGPVRQQAMPGSQALAIGAPPASVPGRAEAAGNEWRSDRPDVVGTPDPAALQTPFVDSTTHAWTARRWLGPVVAALVLLAAGVFCLGAQYWIPSSMEMDPSKFHGLNVQPWGQFIPMAAPYLLGSGLGILGGLLFVASRRRADRETALRAAFALLAIAVGVCGWLALFATEIFPQELPDYGSVNGVQPQLPLAYLLMPTGTWLLSLALFMVAVLFVVPRRWQRPWTEAGAGTAQEAPAGSQASAPLGLLFGAVATAAGLAALFAQYMFPLSSGSITVTMADGGTSHQPDWAALAPALATPLMLSGLVVFSWACIWLAVAPGRDSGPAAELDWSGVAPPENWSAAD